MWQEAKGEMSTLKFSLALVPLFVSLHFLHGAGSASSCFPVELPMPVNITPGSLEHALRGLDPLHNCTVQLYLLSGVHVISSGVAVSAASVAISSHPSNTGRPVVRCGDNMSHPGDYVNETEVVGFLTFWKGTREVSISGVDFEGCPRTVQFIEVDRVSISDCRFRLATQCVCVCVYAYLLVFRCSMGLLAIRAVYTRHAALIIWKLHWVRMANMKCLTQVVIGWFVI